MGRQSLDILMLCDIVLLLIQIEKMSEAFQDNFPKLLPTFPLRQKKWKVLLSLAFLKDFLLN